MARILIAMLLAAVIGGGAVYGAMLYLDRNPVDLEIPALGSVPLPNPTPSATTPPARQSQIATPTGIPATETPPPQPPTPAASPPATTAAPTPVTDASAEREIVLNAFGECAGQYSGDDKHFRMQAADDAISGGRQTVAEVRRLVEEHCDGVFPNTPAAALAPTPTPQAGPETAPARPTAPPATPTATPEPAHTPRPIADASPDLRHIEEKQYMLELINAERTRAGVPTVVLGDNIAAQLHAESALENCFSSHWGVDGLKPYMRYSLAGGYQSNGENGSGLDYCIKPADNYRAIAGIREEIREAMEGWMDSPGHRRNLLDPHHRRVNIGLAWDRYNTAMYQHFEGGYVEYDRLPTISDGILELSGRTRNGIRFRGPRDLSVDLYYDPPPSALTRGQVARTYCYDLGRQVAGLRQPLTDGSYWATHEFTITHDPCPSPYDVDPDAPAPRSPGEAYLAWEEAYNASFQVESQSITVPWITAEEMTASGTSFAARADISAVLDRFGSGVYSVLVFGDFGGVLEVISEYSIFHGVTPPDTYRNGAR